MKRLLFLLLLIVAAPAQAEVAIQQVTSPGGFKAWLVEEHSIPFTALEIRFRGGASLDAPGKRGAINLMTATLEEGAGEMDSQAFAAAREALAASYSFDVGDDTLSISSKFLSENRAQAVALLKAAITAPRFDQSAIDRVRGQVLSNLKSRETDPNAMAGKVFDRLAYGDHPYGSYLGGTAESVKALSRDDIVDAWHRTMARDRVYVAAVGDITAEELGKIMDDLLGGLPAKGAPLPPEVPFGATGGTTVVPFDTPQAVAQFGESGISIKDPDFFAAYILNTIFGGGGFNSRLTDEVRKKRGLTYGIRTYLIDSDLSESLVGVVSSVNDNMAETIAVVKDEWRKIAENGITQEELDKAKTYLTGAYPLRFDGNAPIARILVSMQMDDYPRDYIQHRNDYVNAVTLEQANRVAKRLFRPDDLRFVVVGEPKGLDSSN